MTAFADMEAPSPLFRVHRYEHEGREHAHYWFICPGCNEGHAFDERWTFDGDYEAPTFSPSLLVTHPIRLQGADFEMRCHSFVRAGKIEFLADCTHNLAGQTVPIPEWDDARVMGRHDE